MGAGFRYKKNDFGRDISEFITALNNPDLFLNKELRIAYALAKRDAGVRISSNYL